MNINTSNGTYVLTYEDAYTIRVTVTNQETLDILIDGLELVTGTRYTPETNNTVLVATQDMSDYMSFEIENFLQHE